MRPTVTETLANMRRILEDLVAPEVAAAYPAHMLRGLVVNLGRLEQTWQDVVPFLEWDAEQTAALLRRLGRNVPAGDGDALRDALAGAVPELEVGGQDFLAVLAHLRERAERFPFEWTWVPPPSG